MRLKHLTIANCNRVCDIDIDVRGNLVLIGPNGSGKTTVLLCLDTLLGRGDKRLYGAFSPDLIRDASQPMTVEAVFTDLNANELATFSNEVVANGSDLPVRLEARLAGCGNTTVIGHNGSDISEVHDYTKATGNNLAEATGDNSTSAISISRVFPGGGANNEPSKVQLESLGWTALHAQSYRAYSSGSHELVAKATRDLAHASANVLAIDEPEAHLHPSSQRSLAKMLKAESCQKILVTHSPTIAGSFEPDEIVVIRADGRAIQPKPGFMEGDVGMHARWWIGRQLEPLTAGSVIAVEGPSDRIIVDRVANAMDFDLDRHDVVLVETSGCGDMKVIESIFGRGGFDIPLFELIDKDAADDASARLKVPEADLESCNVFVSTNDLEDEYVKAIGAKPLWDRFKAAKTFSRAALAQCETGADGYPTEAELARFIRSRSRRKIPAALVAASLIDEASAQRIRSVANLLKAAEAQSSQNA